jgi:predicted transcriptional regulator
MGCAKPNNQVSEDPRYALSEAEELAVVYAYQKTRKTYQQIAEDFGVSRKTVDNILTRLGVKRTRKGAA